MTVLLLVLYIAIGVGCAVLRLSVAAVGVMVLVLAVVGGIVGYHQGWLVATGLVFAPIVLIEIAYYVGMLMLAPIVSPDKNRPSTSLLDRLRGQRKEPQARL